MYFLTFLLWRDGGSWNPVIALLSGGGGGGGGGGGADVYQTKAAG